MDAEMAWAAGLFEGEGSITVKEHQIRLRLWMTDEDVVRRFADIMKVGRFRGPYGPYDRGTKPLWAWESSRSVETRLAIELLRPWFGIRRTAQLQSAMAKAGWI